MFNIVEKRRWFFLLSAFVIVPGIAIMIYSTVTTGAPFRLNIDFTGGSIYELQFAEAGATEANIRSVFNDFGDDNVIIQQLGGADAYRWSVRGSFLDNDIVEQILAQLETIAPLDRDNFRIEQVSATIGQEDEGWNEMPDERGSDVESRARHDSASVQLGVVA